MGPFLGTETTAQKLAYHQREKARWEAYIASPKFKKRSKSEQSAILREPSIHEAQIRRYEQEMAK
jgi:hypothetical protein